MSDIHTAWSLFCQTLTGQCTTVLTNQKAKYRKGINFYRCFDLLLHTSSKNMLSKHAIASHKSVISVIKNWGIATFDISVCFCWGLMRYSVTMHRLKQNRFFKEIRKFHILLQFAPWVYDIRFNFQGVLVSVVQHSGCTLYSVVQHLGCTLVTES